MPLFVQISLNLAPWNLFIFIATLVVAIYLSQISLPELATYANTTA